MGAKIENSGGDQLVEVAACEASGEGAEAVVMLLLNRGVKPTVASWLGGALKGSVGVCKILLEKDPELLEAMDDKKHTALVKAVMRNKPSMVEFLVSKKANLQVTWAKGKLPLNSAIYNNYSRVAKNLIKGGADVNAKDFSGRTPLMRALNTKDEEVIMMLMHAGADPEIIDPETNDVMRDPESKKTVFEMFEGEDDILKILKGQPMTSPRSPKSMSPGTPFSLRRSLLVVSDVFLAPHLS